MSFLPIPKALDQYRFILHPHYWLNIILSSSFFILKTMPFACDFLFEVCGFEMREMELLTFLGCILALKTRKERSSFKNYLHSLCMFTKILSVLLYGRHSPIFALLYVVVCLVHLVFVPAPSTYGGPESITYFRGVNLQDELNRDKRIVWFITFYAPWSPPCVTFADVFAKLSYDYSLDNIKFGKIDASRYQDVTEQFRVDGTSWSKQLPTIIMFENGKEKMRRPYVDYKGTVQKFAFTEKSMKDHFQMDELYKRQLSNPIKKQASKPQSEKKSD